MSTRTSVTPAPALTKALADGNYLRLDTSNGPLVGNLGIQPISMVGADIALEVIPQEFVLQAAGKGAGTANAKGLYIEMDLANVLAPYYYGYLLGAEIYVSNYDSYGISYGTQPPYALRATYYDYGAQGTSYSGQIALNYDGTANANSHIALYVTASDNNTYSGGFTGGIFAAQFRAANSTSAGGHTRAYYGYAENTSGTNTGYCAGVVGNTNIGTGTPMGIAFFGIAPPSANANQKYAFVGNNSLGPAMNLFAQTWITSTQSLVSSNPSGHLTIGPTNYDLYIEDDLEVDGTAYLDGPLAHAGSTLGLYGATPVAQSAAYSVSNVTTDRAYDANSTSIDELADVLGTLIADLQATGIIG